MKLEKVYLVIHNWSCESSGNVDMQDIYVWKDYESAKFQFERIRREIKSYDLGYGEIEDTKDYYCESEDGEYLYYHELVYIEEKEILDYE